MSKTSTEIKMTKKNQTCIIYYKLNKLLVKFIRIDFYSNQKTCH